MDPIHIVYRHETRQPQMDDKAQWNLKGNVRFLESSNVTQRLSYYMIEGPDLEDPENTVANYQASIEKQIKTFEIRSGANCLAKVTLPSYFKEDKSDTTSKGKGHAKAQVPKTHEELKEDMAAAIKTCRGTKAGGQLVILVLKSKQIPAYSAFKNVADCMAGLHSLCLTEVKNLGRLADDKDLALYIANVMMKVNLKLRGRNHTSADSANREGRLSETLFKSTGRSTMILGADVSIPSTLCNDIMADI